MEPAKSRVLASTLLLAFLLAGTCRAGSLLDDLWQPEDGRSRRATSTQRLPDGRPDPNGNGDNLRVLPGQKHVLADLKGPGIITHIWMTFLGPEPHPWAPNGAANHKQMLLRAHWDGNDQPDIDTPVGDFFACGFGMRMPVNSLPVQVENGAAYNCFWPMPFRKSARIEIVNDSDREIALLYYNIDWVQKDSLPRNTPYFHAQYRQEYPVGGGGDYLIFDGEGRGHYVGTVLSVRSRSPGWFGEGDEKVYIDDDKEPSIWGTGTEDYLLCAWGLRKCGFPFFGVPHTDGGHVLGGKTCAYRWHLADPIVFQKKLRVTIEHFGWISPDENPKHESDSWNERQDDYSSVAFWYQVGKPKRFATVPPAAERELPEIDIVLRGKDFIENRYHGDGPAIVQTGSQWRGSSQMLYQPPSQQDAWVEVPFEVPRREPKRLLLKLTTSYDFGIYDVYLDGVKVGGSLDLYTPDIEVREFPLLDFWPEQGPHKLKLVCVGMNPLSKGHWLGFDSLRLRERRPRVLQYGWDKDADWRKDRPLY
jgi:hypothetical protein